MIFKFVRPPLYEFVKFSNIYMDKKTIRKMWYIGRHLGFFKIFILRKIAANFTKISRKHVFVASNRKIIKNRV